MLCQVTKNPIGTKGARLTQEVSLAGRFVVLIPNSSTYGISKRLADDERKRLRRILDDVRPEGHGLIVRTAAEGATPEELRRDVQRLQREWAHIEKLAARAAPALLYREPTLAVRVIREEFNKDYRGVIIDDPELLRARSTTTWPPSSPSWSTASSCTRRPTCCPSSSASTSTSSSTRRSTARCGCRRAGR